MYIERIERIEHRTQNTEILIYTWLQSPKFGDLHHFEDFPTLLRIDYYFGDSSDFLEVPLTIVEILLTNFGDSSQ